MPLTPEDVSNKRFTAVRLREGYDMTEVDQFLDEVEAELARLLGENEELRAKLRAAATTTGAGVAAQPQERAQEQVGSNGQAPSLDEVTATDGAFPQLPNQAEPQPEDHAQSQSQSQSQAQAETLLVRTTPEASAAAIRLLELATRNADELLDDARQQAEAMLGSARSDAERVQAEARSRSADLDTETQQRRVQLFSQLERERDTLTTEVEGLRTFEREYRSQLKDYFSRQLAALDAPMVDIASLDGAGSA